MTDGWMNGWTDNANSRVASRLKISHIYSPFFSQKLIEVVHGHLERGWHSGGQLDQWLSSLSTFPADMSWSINVSRDMIPYKHWDIGQDDRISQGSRTLVWTVVVGPLHPEVNLGSILRPLHILSLPNLFIDVRTNFLHSQLSARKVFLRKTNKLRKS